MTAYDWMMAFGAVVIIGIVVKGFWKADKTEAIEQPDNWQSSGGDPPGGHQ